MEPDNLEIEVKFFLPDLPAARRAVLALGAESRGRVFEKNTLFDTPDRRLARGRCLLRVREDGRCLLTFKSPPGVEDPGFKVFVEREVEVSDARVMEAILLGLGFLPGRTYEKYRETLVLGKLKILLDETPFGDFLELEGTREDIRRAAESLGLAWEDRVTENYLQIFAAVREAMGLSFSDPTFENFAGIAPDTRAGLDLLRKKQGFDQADKEDERL